MFLRIWIRPRFVGYRIELVYIYVKTFAAQQAWERDDWRDFNKFW